MFGGMFQRSGPVTGDPDMFSLWARFTSDSKTDPWDDLEIRINSCGEDQTSIRFRNHVISVSIFFMSFPYLLLIISNCVLLALFNVGN